MRRKIGHGLDPIDNSEDIIYSRDVIERIKTLEEWRDEALERYHEIQENIAAATDDDIPDLEAEIWTSEDGNEYGQTDDWDEDTALELKSLLALAEEASGSPDWSHGEALIRDSYFEDYARELADDIGAINSDAGWPTCHIDWEAAADALKQDYTSVDFDGVEYWIRS